MQKRRAVVAGLPQLVLSGHVVGARSHYRFHLSADR
jgi:hypothetical protein